MSRTSFRVGIKGARTLYYAERHAERIGNPLNVSITLNLTMLGIAAVDTTAAFGRLRRERFSPWVRRPPKQARAKAGTPTYSYGFENSRNGAACTSRTGPHNIHVHWAAHVPPARRHDFDCQMVAWVDELAGTQNWPQPALEVRTIHRPGKVADYPIKGASPEIAAHFGRTAEPQGIIFGVRTGTTRNIGPAARRAADKAQGIDRRRRKRRPSP